MKKGFTLVELLIVVVVIVTLMAISFRIGRAGESAEAHSKTVNRMQKLENCLSGYYAAYGSYPPVSLHGDRDYTYNVNDYGIQKIDNNDRWSEGEMSSNWKSVEAACRSQPVAYECPFPTKMAAAVKAYFQALGKNITPLEGVYTLPGGMEDMAQWKDLQVFKFGLLSYLLPRYVILLDDDGGGFNNEFYLLLEKYSQWTGNNELPSDFESGQPFENWRKAFGDSDNGLLRDENRWKLAALPSQAVCARWIANLERLVYGAMDDEREVYGVKIIYDQKWYSHVYVGSQTQGGDSGTPYALREFTVKDGWGNEFYYYSPAPYQTYTLWSAGEDGKTFPPWVPDEEFRNMGSDRQTALKWLSDDIMHMKN